MYRGQNALLPIEYYNKLPRDADCDVAIVLEPMIATGKFYFKFKDVPHR